MGKTVELSLKKGPDGYTTSLTPTEPGLHKVTVDFDRKPVPGSPFSVDVVPKGGKSNRPNGKDETDGALTLKGLDKRK